MIGSLRGTIVHRSARGEVLLEVGGVGYRVTVPPATMAHLGELGATALVHTHLAVREDSLTLFGFATRDERDCFEALIGAHGVGPALALAILSVHGPALLRQALADGDLDALCLVPGVGRKTAARLMIELKSRLDLPDDDLEAAVAANGHGARPRQRQRVASPTGPRCGPPWPPSATRPTRSTAPCATCPPRAASKTSSAAPSASSEPVDDRSGVQFRGICHPTAHQGAAGDAQRAAGHRPRARGGHRGGHPPAPPAGEFVGQGQLRQHLDILLGAARGRGEPVDHLLFAGPPGLGKTSLAGIVAAEMGVGFRITSGPALERAGDLASVLTNLVEGDVLFIDEIHRLSRVVEEVLYPAMEDFQLDIMIGKGPSARSIRLDLPRFTLVGATTRTGLITGPLRDRFGFVARLDYYRVDELEAIVRRAAGIMGVPLEAEGGFEIARRARGTPRIANRLLRRVRDFAEVRGDGVVTRATADAALELFEVDAHGPRQGRPGHPQRRLRPLRRRPGGPVHGRHLRGRGAGDGGGRLRALPPPARPPPAHPPGPGGHPRRLAAPRPGATGGRRRPARRGPPLRLTRA